MANRFINREEEQLEQRKTDDVAAIGEGNLESSASKKEGREEEKKIEKKRKGGLSSVLGADILGDKYVLRQIPLVVLIMVILMITVLCRYRVETLMRTKVQTEKRVEYLRQRHIQLQKQYQHGVQVSTVAERLKGTGVGIEAGPPYELQRR